jgi:hypothetical protein
MARPSSLRDLPVFFCSSLEFVRVRKTIFWPVRLGSARWLVIAEPMSNAQKPINFCAALQYCPHVRRRNPLFENASRLAKERRLLGLIWFAMLNPHTYYAWPMRSRRLRPAMMLRCSAPRSVAVTRLCLRLLRLSGWTLPVGLVLTLLTVSPAWSARSSGTSTTTNASDLTELSLETLMEIEVPKVFGASKIEQRTTEAPSSVTVINADEIKRYGHRTLADVLQSVRGLHVSYDRNYAFLGTRGVSLGDFNSRILLLVDGHRVNNNLTDGAFIDTAFLLDVDLIDRVEVIRGPGSVLYGNNAFFGVINVITRTGKQLNGAEVSGEFAEFDTYKGRATFGKAFTNGVQLLLSGTYYDSAGPDKLSYKEFNTPAQNNGVAQNMDGDSFKSFFGSLSYRDFTLEGAFSSREKAIPRPSLLRLSMIHDCAPRMSEATRI